MALEVLQNKSQIETSRAELKRRGVSQIATPLRRAINRIRRSKSIAMGDHIKSWDVLRTLSFLEERVGFDQPILDIGCYASEILMALHETGFSSLHGADLNPDISSMPHQGQIHYEVTDFMRTPFADSSFSAITSMSVIEHGFDQAKLLTEMSRLLTPGGYFIASFDYWPDKIDTSGVKFFDMEWTIFSSSEVDDLTEDAANFNLYPVGKMDHLVTDRPIKCGGKAYTFAWLVLRKPASL